MANGGRMKRQFVKDLKVGMAVDDVFLCVRRDVKDRRDGGQFLTLELKDKTGTIPAIIWDRVEDALACVQAGGFYHVQGKVGDYQGKPQLTVSLIWPAAKDELSRDDFIGVSRFDRSQLLSELRGYIAGVRNQHLARLLASFFDDPEFVEQFSTAPGGAQVHHDYLSGLIEHVVFMCRNARSIADTYPEVDRDLLIAGVILHDVGKVKEYTYETAIDHTLDGRLIGHLVLGYEMVKARIAEHKDFPGELARMLLHIILSHHGHLEFGSPKTPKFAEAFIVYFLDNLDARMMMFRDVVEKNPGTKWTDFHQYLETNVYIPEPKTNQKVL